MGDRGKTQDWGRDGLWSLVPFDLVTDHGIYGEIKIRWKISFDTALMQSFQ